MITGGGFWYLGLLFPQPIIGSWYLNPKRRLFDRLGKVGLDEQTLQTETGRFDLLSPAFFAVDQSH